MRKEEVLRTGQLPFVHEVQTTGVPLHPIQDLQRPQDPHTIEVKVNKNTSRQKSLIRTAGAVILIQDQVLHPGHPVLTLAREVHQVLLQHTESQAATLLTDRIHDRAVVPTGRIHDQVAVARVVHLQAIQEVVVVEAILHRVDQVVQAVRTVAEVHQEVRDHHPVVRLLPEVLLPEVAEDRNYKSVRNKFVKS